MPPYNTAPWVPSQGLIKGFPAYSFGSNPGRNTGPAKMFVSSIAVAANVVTLGVQLLTGNIPAVGDLVTTLNLPVPAANVSSVALTGVSITPSTGIGTITYPATTANLSSIPASGQVMSTPSEVGDAAVIGPGLQFAVPTGYSVPGAYGFSWAYTFPSQPATGSIQLEGAINDNPPEYALIGTAQTTLTGYNTIVSQVPNLVRFLRLNLTALTGGTNPTVIGKLLLS